jgi:Na+/phosphate symporter
MAAVRAGSTVAAGSIRGVEMPRLFGLMFSLLSTALMGSGVVVALTAGFVTLKAIALAAAFGFVLALPVAWIIARRLAG